MSEEDQDKKSPARYVPVEGLLRTSILTTTTTKLYNYIALVDQKATGLIILNSFIIPVAINGLDKPEFQTAATISIFTSIFSIFLAIWCIFPKRGDAYKPGGDRNLFHYSDIGALKEEEYEQLFYPIYNDTKRLTEEVVKDIHDVSHRVLKPKFRLLKLCYITFFAGNLAALLSYFVPVWM